MRNYRGFEFNNGYPNCELSLEQFQHIVTPELLQQLVRPEPSQGSFQPVLHIKRGITFNGNLGDFASARDAVEIVEYISEFGVPVEINTNGSLRNARWWARLARPNVVVGFALDGLADTHALYRQDTDWHKIIDNAQALIAAGGRAWWRFVPFDHNRHQESQCKQLSKDLGFEKFENIYDGRNNGPVFDRSGQYSHQIGHDARPAHIVPDINPLLENHITWYNAKTIQHPRDTPELDIFCIHEKNREIYIAADGSIYPCCYLGFYPQTMNHPGNKELRGIVKQNNALKYPLEHCLQWFDQIEQSWQAASIAQGRTYQCIATCNRKQHDIS
jgi:MoaA/NifB/PqqE/SkfB family radical SAM enzyme